MAYHWYLRMWPHARSCRRCLSTVAQDLLGICTLEGNLLCTMAIIECARARRLEGALSQASWRNNSSC